MTAATPGPDATPNISSQADPLTGLRVLVVEDEPMILMTLEDILADLGVEVVATATSHGEALVAAQSADFDVAILDVTLGNDKIDDVSQLIRNSKRPIVYASGCDPRELAQRFGADCTAIDKPYSLSEVARGLRTSLTTSRC